MGENRNAMPGVHDAWADGGRRATDDEGSALTGALEPWRRGGAGARYANACRFSNLRRHGRRRSAWRLRGLHVVVVVVVECSGGEGGWCVGVVVVERRVQAKARV